MNRAIIFTLFSLNLLGVDWKPVTPEELSLKTPKLDPNADAESIFTDLRVYDMVRSLPYVEHHVDYYVRIKIYNDRGVKAHTTVDIPYTSRAKMTIANVKARTIKPDGTIVEMKNDAIFDKTDTKVGRRVVEKTRSFTLPAVEPGSIVEYQYGEVFSEFLPRYVRLEAQREIPVWKVNYFVRPLLHEAFSSRMFTYPFNCQIPPWKEVKLPDLFFYTTLDNLPAFKDEPDTNADDDLKQWVLIYYSQNEIKEPKKYWPKIGRELHDEFQKEVKVNGDIKTLAAEITSGAATPEEKINKIADFCRTKVKNVFHETAGITAEERSKFKPKEIQMTSDTAKIRIGYPSDINKLFVALAAGAGFEARGVRASSATTAYFRGDLFDPYLLTSRLAAVKIGTEWRYYNVTNPYIPAGMVDWDEEGVPAIVLDNKEPILGNIPPSMPENTLTDRHAKLTLLEDGSIEGQITMALTGHNSVRTKTVLQVLSDAKRQENVKDSLRAIHGEAEVTNIKIENVTDPLKPLIYTYDIKVAGYAQRTGKRLFFQPNFFSHGRQPRFTNAERKHPIAFRYAFTEMDTVDVTVPEGFSLEAAESPGDLAFPPVGEQKISIGIKGKTLVYRRHFIWGKQGMLQFDAKAYPQMKKIWDTIHERDQHTMTLRQQ